MPKFEHKELRGSVFANDRPGIHLGGEVKVNGKVYWITIWDRDEGKIHWGVSLKEKMARQEPVAAEADRRAEMPPDDDLDDLIPWGD